MELKTDWNDNTKNVMEIENSVRAGVSWQSSIRTSKQTSESQKQTHIKSLPGFSDKNMIQRRHEASSRCWPGPKQSFLTCTMPDSPSHYEPFLPLAQRQVTLTLCPLHVMGFGAIMEQLLLYVFQLELSSVASKFIQKIKGQTLV